MHHRPYDLALFVLLLLVYSYFIQPAQANALSRYNLVRALVDDRTVAVDRYAGNTIDKTARDGHYYSDKAPGSSLLALPSYMALRGFEVVLLGGRDLEETHRVHLLTVGAVAVPAAALAVLLLRVLDRLGGTSRRNLLLAVAYGLGTVALPFSTLFFGHQPAALLGFAAFYLLLGVRLGDRSWRWSLVAGCLAGLAVATEYPAALLAALLFGYAGLAIPGRRAGLGFAVGAAPALALLGLYQTAAYGAPWRTPSCCLVEAQFAGASQGVNGVGLPDPGVLVDLLFAGRGLLTLSPFLVLVPLGIVRLWRQPGHRAEAALIAAVVGVFLLYNSGYYLPFGGWTPGPRFLLPALPFAVGALGPVVNRPGRVRVLFWFLMAYSFVPAWTATATVALTPDVGLFPLIDFWLPALRHGYIVHNLGRLLFGLDGFAGLVPLIALLGVGLGMLFFRPTPAKRGGAEKAIVLIAAAWSLFILPFLIAGQGAAAGSGEGQVVVESLTIDWQRVKPGDVQVARFLLRNGPAPQYDIAAWIEVVDRAGRRTEEGWANPLNLRPGEVRELDLALAIPTTAEPGRRMVKLQVLHPSWSRAVGLAGEPAVYEVAGAGGGQ